MALFHEALLTALGFTRRDDVEGWLQFVSEENPPGEFFGVTESPSRVPNENRVAFRAESMEKVRRLPPMSRRILWFTTPMKSAAGDDLRTKPPDITPGHHRVGGAAATRSRCKPAKRPCEPGIHALAILDLCFSTSSTEQDRPGTGMLS